MELVPVRVAIGALALLFGARRLSRWRRTGAFEELLRACVHGGVLLLALTWHRAATLLLAALLAWFGVFWFRRRRQPRSQIIGLIADANEVLGKPEDTPLMVAALDAGAGLARLSGPALAKRLRDANPHIRRQVVALLAKRGDLAALGEQLAIERDADVRARIALALADGGKTVEAAIWLDLLRSPHADDTAKTRARQALVATHSAEVLPYLLEIAGSARTGQSHDRDVLDATRAMLRASASDALRERITPDWISACLRAATRVLFDRSSRTLAAAVAQDLRALQSLVEGTQLEAAKRLDWLLQEYELRRAFPDYEQSRAAGPKVVGESGKRMRFRMEQAGRWNVEPDGSLALAAGWHTADAVLDFAEHPSAEEGLDLPRLRLALQQADGSYELEALLDPWSLLEIALAPATPRAFLVRCSGAWRNALATQLVMTNIRGLNDSRGYMELAIEGQRTQVHLKYQSPRFDCAFLPAQSSREPEASARSDSPEDETRLLFVVRGVSGDADAPDGPGEIPPFVCAVRIATLLGALEPLSSRDGEDDIPNPRVSRV